jgi:hypothetical protein
MISRCKGPAQNKRWESRRCERVRRRKRRKRRRRSEVV